MEPHGVHLFGVFDGHGGKRNKRFYNILWLLIGQEVALFAQRYFAKELMRLENYKNQNYKEALEEVFLVLDQLMLTEDGYKELVSF